MPEKNSHVLYLSKDKRYLINNKGDIISTRMYVKGEAYYKPLAIESEAFEKICLQLRPQQVCILWDEHYNCLVWGAIYVCSHWEWIPKGFSNIS